MYIAVNDESCFPLSTDRCSMTVTDNTLGTTGRHRRATWFWSLSLAGISIHYHLPMYKTFIHSFIQLKSSILHKVDSDMLSIIAATRPTSSSDDAIDFKGRIYTVISSSVTPPTPLPPDSPLHSGAHTTNLNLYTSNYNPHIRWQHCPQPLYTSSQRR